MSSAKRSLRVAASPSRKSALVTLPLDDVVRQDVRERLQPEDLLLGELQVLAHARERGVRGREHRQLLVPGERLQELSLLHRRAQHGEVVAEHGGARHDARGGGHRGRRAARPRRAPHRPATGATRALDAVTDIIVSVRTCASRSARVMARAPIRARDVGETGRASRGVGRASANGRSPNRRTHTRIFPTENTYGTAHLCFFFFFFPKRRENRAPSLSLHPHGSDSDARNARQPT